jgi:hypothetical protein
MAPVMPTVRSRERAREAFDLRSNRMPWSEVAKRLGYRSIGAAQTAVKRHVERNSRDSTQVQVATHCNGVEVRIRSMMTMYVQAYRSNDVGSVVLLNREIRANEDHLAKIGGLYAPAKSEVDVRSDPGAVVGDFFAALLAGGRPAVPLRSALSAQAPLEVEVVDQ